MNEAMTGDRYRIVAIFTLAGAAFGVLLGMLRFNDTYSYDAADRLTQKTENGRATTYSYDATDQLTADGPTGYSYHANGNRTGGGYATGTGKGRKRHAWVDSLGLLLAVLVTAADVHDSRAACELFHRRAWEGLPRLGVVYTDAHSTAWYLDEEVFDYAPFRRVVVSRPAGAEGFVKLPQRWVVERTFAWLYRSRRLSKDYEFLPESGEAMIRVSMIHLMLRRLAPVPRPYTQRFRYAR